MGMGMSIGVDVNFQYSINISTDISVIFNNEYNTGITLPVLSALQLAALLQILRLQTQATGCPPNSESDLSWRFALYPKILCDYPLHFPAMAIMPFVN